MNGDILQSGVQCRGSVLVRDGLVAKIITDKTEDTIETEKIDCAGCVISPGFFDLHCLGAAGHASFEGTRKALEVISCSLARHGTTSFLMGVNSAPFEKMLELISVAREAVTNGLPGARLEGIHFEGPYLAPLKKGGMPSAALRKPDINELAALVDRGQGVFRMMTLSPEIPGAMEAVEFLVKNGIVAAAGHTNADHLIVGKAIDRGLRHVTHIFNNGEDGIGQEKGIFDEKSCVLDFLLRDELTAGIIADGVHVPPRMMELLYRVKGHARTAVTTDACLAADYNRERFTFTELTGEVRDFVVRGALYEASTGQLCGSVLTMEKGFANIQTMAKVGRADAAYSCATLPHRILGNKNKGIIREGAAADIAVINHDGVVTLTLADGKIVYRLN